MLQILVNVLYIILGVVSVCFMVPGLLSLALAEYIMEKYNERNYDNGDAI